MTEGRSIPNSDATMPAEEVPLGAKVDIKDLPALPSLTLVDKHLNTIAKFYGDSKELKMRFGETLEDAVFLTEYNGRRIYMMPSE